MPTPVGCAWRRVAVRKKTRVGVPPSSFGINKTIWRRLASRIGLTCLFFPFNCGTPGCSSLSPGQTQANRCPYVRQHDVRGNEPGNGRRAALARCDCEDSRGMGPRTIRFQPRSRALHVQGQSRFSDRMLIGGNESGILAVKAPNDPHTIHARAETSSSPHT